jgi:hypothetical protein
VTDSRMRPVPSHALTELWHAMAGASEDIERAGEIQIANHDYDPYCACDQCLEVEDIDRRVGGLVIDAALAFRDACEGSQQPLAAAS